MKTENKWIDANKHLPEKGVDVLCKVKQLAWISSPYAVAHLKEEYLKDVWMIEGRHCSHYKDAINNGVTHWQPIID